MSSVTGGASVVEVAGTNLLAGEAMREWILPCCKALFTFGILDVSSVTERRSEPTPQTYGTHSESPAPPLILR